MNNLAQDVVYYSNYCEHSKRILQFISRHGLIERLSCICVDKRVQDPQTFQYKIQTERGNLLALPPVIHNVPSILCVKKHCIVVCGEGECLRYLANIFQIPNDPNMPTTRDGAVNAFEPVSAYAGNTNNFVSVNTPSTLSIPTPQEHYQPDKIGANVSIDVLQEQRMKSLGGI